MSCCYTGGRAHTERIDLETFWYKLVVPPWGHGTSQKRLLNISSFLPFFSTLFLPIPDLWSLPKQLLLLLSQPLLLHLLQPHLAVAYCESGRELPPLLHWSTLGDPLLVQGCRKRQEWVQMCYCWCYFKHCIGLILHEFVSLKVVYWDSKWKKVLRETGESSLPLTRLRTVYILWRKVQTKQQSVFLANGGRSSGSQLSGMRYLTFSFCPLSVVEPERYVAVLPMTCFNIERGFPGRQTIHYLVRNTHL